MSSGDDLKAGRSVGGESTTELAGQGKGTSDFSGSVIFLVKPFPLGGGGGHVPPAHQVSAVRGEGIFAGDGLVGQGGDDDGGTSPGGSGVSGSGGKGSGLPAPTAGGIGVRAAGGDAHHPATGGAGVVAAGGIGRDAGGTPRNGGIGVLGLGGLQTSAGVVGVAGGRTAPNPNTLGAPGVHGLGSVGVHGVGDSTAGILGDCASGRGGIFSTTAPAGVAQAQIQLVPHSPEPTPKLPKQGATGDLLVSSNAEGQGKLFFCVQGFPQANPARWAEVQLVTPFIPGNA